jgi:hypothetical protein
MSDETLREWPREAEVEIGERAAFRKRKRWVRCDGCGRGILPNDRQCPWCHTLQGDDEETNGEPMRVDTDMYYTLVEDEYCFRVSGNVHIQTVPFGHDADGRRGGTCEEIDLDDVSVALDGNLVTRCAEVEDLFRAAEERLVEVARAAMEPTGE